MPDNYHHLHFEVVGSTNDLCRIECKKKLKPTLITADKQTDGRGRNQKKWESPKGNISFSYGFFCEKPHPALSLLAGLKTKIALEKVFGKETFENMIRNDPELHRGMLEVVEMFRNRDKEGLKMYLQKFLPHLSQQRYKDK